METVCQTAVGYHEPSKNLLHPPPLVAWSLIEDALRLSASCHLIPLLPIHLTPESTSHPQSFISTKSVYDVPSRTGYSDCKLNGSLRKERKLNIPRLSTRPGLDAKTSTYTRTSALFDRLIPYPITLGRYASGPPDFAGGVVKDQVHFLPAHQRMGSDKHIFRITNATL